MEVTLMEVLSSTPRTQPRQRKPAHMLASGKAARVARPRLQGLT